MMSIAEALNCKDRAEPYQCGIKGTVAKVVQNSVMLANERDVIKVVTSRMQESEKRKLQEGSTVIVRFFKKGKFNCLLFNEKTKVTITGTERLPDAVLERAQEILCPKTPPRTNIKEIGEQSGLTTIEGDVVMVSNYLQ